MPSHEQLLICKFTNIEDNKDGCNLKLENIEEYAIRAMKSDYLQEMSSKGIVSVLFKFNLFIFITLISQTYIGEFYVCTEKEQKVSFLFEWLKHLTFYHEVLVAMASLEKPIESHFWDNHLITYPCKDIKKTLWWVGKFHHPWISGKFIFLFCSLRPKDFAVDTGANYMIPNIDINFGIDEIE